MSGETPLLNPHRESDWGRGRDEVGNVIPEWVADAGLARAWIFCEDVLNFRWPFARGEAGKDKGE